METCVPDSSYVKSGERTRLGPSWHLCLCPAASQNLSDPKTIATLNQVLLVDLTSQQDEHGDSWNCRWISEKRKRPLNDPTLQRAILGTTTQTFNVHS